MLSIASPYPRIRGLTARTAAFGIVVLLGSGGVAHALSDSGPRFRVDLAGDQVVPPVETETTGEFRLRLDEGLTEAEARLNVRDGVAVTEAHLHCAAAGENGPLVAFLFGPVPDGVDVDGDIANFNMLDADITATGADCVFAIGLAINNLADLTQAMENGNIYADVHTLSNPSGEIRAQVALEVECPADLNEDDEVGAADLAELLGSWGPNPDDPADLNGDGTVGAADLAQLLGSWGPCPNA